MGIAPGDYVSELALARLDGRSGAWMRVDGLAGLPALQGVAIDGSRTPALDRKVLMSLRAHGIKPMIVIRNLIGAWVGGIRVGGGYRLPLDLREAYERGRWLASTYGDLVSCWEIDNEPDIGFVADNPETYSAYLKATYLGLKAGFRSYDQVAASLELNSDSSKLLVSSSSWLARKRGGSVVYEQRSELTANSSKLVAPPVIMAPLALPPGPYFERLCANGLLSYTDGFNFHYYGYAKDFTGVYRQFEDAVVELGARSSKLTAPSSFLRELPVFITEYGYGLLDGDASKAVEGRVRQWAWYRDVVKQILFLRPEGTMAFVLNPYYEAGLNEFGLTMVDKPKFVAVEDRGAKNTMGGTPMPLKGGQLSFMPTDFGAHGAEPWMNRIGHRLGNHFASPALAYMWDFAERNPYRSRPWQVRVELPSPVVVDFIADRDMVQWKNGGGYLLQAAERLTSTGKQLSGSGRVVLYNFGETEIAGRWEIVGMGAPQSVVLAAGERREFAVELKVQAERFAGEDRRVYFTPDDPRLPRAEWVTQVFPDTDGMVNTMVSSFNFSETKNRERTASLLDRPLALGEPGFKEQGRWLVTDGVRVEESRGVWRFHIDHRPAEPLRPAMVELPLPVEFKIEPDSMITLERRMTAATTPSEVLASVPLARVKPSERVAGSMMDVYFRTENGNLYQTWPRLEVTKEWVSYAESMENFTMGFFGRAALPWRFSKNRPASLVFFLRAAELPIVFEVKGARLVRVGQPKPKR